MTTNEERNLESVNGDERPSFVWVLLALVVLAAGLAPIGLAAFITDVPAMKHAMPAMVPFWLATVATAIFSFYTHSAKVATGIVFMICGLAILNLGGCAFEFARLNRALG